MSYTESKDELREAKSESQRERERERENELKESVWMRSYRDVVD
jgi:hypothetical protein